MEIKRQLVAFLNGYFIVEPGTTTESHTESLLFKSLELELLLNYKCAISDYDAFGTPHVITEDNIKEYFQDVVMFLNRGKCTQPYYPKLIPNNLNNIVENIVKLRRNMSGVRSIVTITESDFLFTIRSSKLRTYLDFQYLWNNEVGKKSNPILRLLYKFYATHLDGKKRLGAIPRKDRIEFLKSLEEKLENAEVADINKIERKYFKGLVKVLHPFDYEKIFPKACEFFRSILYSGIPSSNIIKVLGKAYKVGKEFECFQSWIENPKRSIRELSDLLMDLQFYPRISFYKSYEREKVLGQLIPDEGERDISDAIISVLNNEILSKIKNTNRVFHIPESFKKISIDSLKFQEFSQTTEIDDPTFSIKINSDNVNHNLTAIRLDKSFKIIGPHNIKDPKWVIYYAYSNIIGDDSKAAVILTENGSVSNVEIIDFKKSKILYIYDEENHILKKVFHDHSRYYSGGRLDLFLDKAPCIAEQLIHNVFEESNKMVSLYDICQRLYINSPKGKEITLRHIKEDLYGTDIEK